MSLYEQTRSRILAQYTKNPISPNLPSPGRPGLLVDVGQLIARNIGSAGVTFASMEPPKRNLISPNLPKERLDVEPLTEKDFPSSFGQAFFRGVFGKNAEIKSIEQRIAEAEPRVKAWQEEVGHLSQDTELNKKERFITTVLANLDTPLLVFAGVMGSVSLDLTPFGGFRKGVTEALIKANKTEDALKMLAKMKVPDDIARLRAAEVVAIKTEEQAIKFMEDIAESVRGTATRARTVESPRVGEEVARPVAEPITFPRVPESLEPFAAKARSIKDEAAFMKQFDEGLKSQNLTTRETAQKILQIIKDEGFKDQQDFYKFVHGRKPKEPMAIAPAKATAVDARALEGVVTPKAKVPTKRELIAQGARLSQARAENIAEIVKGRAVRKVELKSLREGIKLNNKRNAIIDKLRHATRISKEIRGMVSEYAHEALPPAVRGKALNLVRDAKSARDMNKAFARIHRWSEDNLKKTIRADLVKAYKRILNSPSVAVDYKKTIEDLMGGIELKAHRPATLERLREIEKFLQRERAKGNDVEMPRQIIKELGLLQRTPLEELTISQLRGLHERMMLLEEMGKTKFRTLKNINENAQQRFFKNVEELNPQQITELPLLRPEIGEQLTITQKLRNFVFDTINRAARTGRAISPIDVLMDTMDGARGTYDGPVSRFFKGQADAAYGRYFSRKNLVQEPVIKLAQDLKLTRGNFERIGVVAAREQDGGLKKLIETGYTKKQVDGVVLTENEQKLLNTIRKVFDEEYEPVADIMRRVYNQKVGKVKNYFSFMTDWKAMEEADISMRFGENIKEFTRKNVERGFTVERTEGEQAIKIDAMEVFLNHTDNTSYLIEMGELSKMLGEVASNPLTRERLGTISQSLLLEWVSVLAEKGGMSGAKQIPILDTLRRNVGAGILGLKLGTVMIQPTAFIDGMGFIGVKHAVSGASDFASSAEWRKFILNMPEIKDRLGGEFALRELTDKNWLEKAQKKGFIPLQVVDQYTAGAIATGAYQRKMMELGRVIDLKNVDPDALAYAQLVVRRTQSSGAFKDVPLAISRGYGLVGNRSVNRALLQFQNFMLTRWSRISHDAIRVGIRTRDPRNAVAIFTAIAFASLAAANMRYGANKITDFITGKEDRDPYEEEIVRSFQYEMMGNVPFMGTITSTMLYDSEPFPILDAPVGAVQSFGRIFTSETEEARLRAWSELIGSTGAMIGIPGSAQAEQLGKGFFADKPIAQGRYDSVREQLLKEYGVGGNNVRRELLDKYGL